MAAASANCADVCRTALQRLRRPDLLFRSRNDSSQWDWVGDFAVRSLGASRAHPSLRDESGCSRVDGMRSGEQGSSSRDIMEGRDRRIRLWRISQRTAFGSRPILRPFSGSSKSCYCTNSSTGPVVAVGMSGGVDSSIAALLLQRQGYEVFGMFMRNWDSSDEAGSTACSMEQDYEDAQRVCRHLGIRLFEVDYHRRYWTDVFETFTRDCALGLTPNPDLACNQHIKFDALLENAKEFGADRLATGHYARLLRPPGGKSVQLLRGVDYEKDQSYFLASVAGHSLERVVFPLGALSKSEVRKLAVSEGLITANKRSSAGICFVGRRNFADFISEYVVMNCGPFIAIEDGSQVGTHEGIAVYTHGQRARIGGKAEASYVVGKDVPNNVVFVAQGPNHCALFCTSAVVDSLSWIAGELPSVLAEGRVLRCLYKARYRQAPEECTVCLASAQSEGALSEGFGSASIHSWEFISSSFCRLSLDGPRGQQLQVRFGTPARAITPGQALVLYLGDICLGAGRILHPGPTLFEQIRNADERG